MKLDVNEIISGNDLAELLRDNEGTFVCFQGGQTFITVAAAGHSIKFGPKPIGPRFAEMSTHNARPWTVLKISNSDLSKDLTATTYRERGVV